MKFEPDKRHRCSIRLRGYDYAQAGGYFVTIVTKDRVCLFGQMVNGKIRLTDGGRIIQATWNELPNHYPGVECDVFVIMPNHVHGIIVLVEDDGGVGSNDVGAGLKPAQPGLRPTTAPRAGLKPAPTRHGLPEIIRGFKTFSARRINDMRKTPGFPIWQRNYYEHIVRCENELTRIREYIANNPLQWDMDRENPLRSLGRRGRFETCPSRSEPWEV
ncbi:MAG: transposase [Deltaproteobacteria bacterium]|nr:transposase [Deltaproteobacteria bacterium]